MEERDDLRKRDPASPRLSTMNDAITKATSDRKRRQWKEFVEIIDHRTDSTKLWTTIKGIDGKSKQTAENEGRSHTSPKLIANSFNRQFTTSKLCKHSSSKRTRHVSKDVKRMSLEQAESFTSDQITRAIKSCGSSRAYGTDTFSIFHLMNLGPLATEHLTSLCNDLISAPKSTVTLFTPDKHQFQMHPDITVEDTQLPLERSPKILGVILVPSISFHKHCNGDRGPQDGQY